MRTVILLMVLIAFIAFGGVPVFAADGDIDTQAQAAASTDTQAATDSGGQQEFKCPGCGEMINIGGHSQSGQTMKCPECGAEVCEKAEEEKEFCFGADAGFFSKYVSRGITWTDGPVFQPDLWASYKGFTLSVWGSMDLTDKYDLGGEISELDYTLDYSNNIGPLAYSGGIIYYTFPNTGDDDTSEVYAGLGYDIMLQPKLVVYYDFWQADGFYGVMSFSHSFELPEVVKGVKSSVDLSAQVGLGSKNYNEFYSGDSHTAFTNYLLTVAIPVSLTDNFSLKPTVSYSSVLDRTIRTKNPHDDNVIFGAVVSASF
jgi:predicted RNA-binding Zn-ribbon protein involved in translation (DUF1610 family)